MCTCTCGGDVCDAADLCLLYAITTLLDRPPSDSMLTVLISDGCIYYPPTISIVDTVC